MQRASSGCRNKWQVDLCLLILRQLDLCFFGSLFEALCCHAINSQVDSMCCFKLLHHPVDHSLVPVVTAEARVAVRALHFKHAVTDLEHADVERAAAQVEHQHCFVFVALIESVCKCCCGWFVDDAQHFEASNCTSFFCGSALCVIEISRHSDHGLCDGVAQICFGIALEFHQCASADFLWRVLLAVYIF